LTHSSVRRHDSRFSATTIGSTNSSSRSLRPPRFEPPDCSIGIDLSGAGSSISFSQRTTLVTEPRGGSTRTSTPISMAAATIFACNGAAQQWPDWGLPFPQLQVLSTTSQVSSRATTTTLQDNVLESSKIIPLKALASASVAFASSPAYHGGVGPRGFVEQSSSSVGALISASSHDKSVDFMCKVIREQTYIKPQ
jgi:hypothetical protein